MATGKANMQSPNSMTMPPNLAERRHRRHVAVPNRGEGLKRPPGRSRDAAEMLGLRAALQEVNDGGGKYEQHHHQQKRAEQRAPFMRYHPLQRLQRRRVADEFEQPEQPQQAQGAEVEGKDLVDVPGQEREQVDDHHRSHRDEPRPLGRQACQQRDLDRATVKTITEKALKASNSAPILRRRNRRSPRRRPRRWQ